MLTALMKLKVEESYLTTFDNGSDLITLNLGSGEPKRFQHRYSNEYMNAIGYNLKDNYIWGWNITAKKVMRLDGNYKVTLYNTSVPTDMFTQETLGFTSGDVSMDGFLYLAKPSLDHKLHKFDLNSGRPIYVGSIDLSNSDLDFGDFAFNPVDNQIYTSYGDTLYRIDPNSGVVTNLGQFTAPTEYYFHSYVFDKLGNIYFYSNQNGGKVYRLNLSNPANPSHVATLFSHLSNATINGDSARCVDAPVPTQSLEPIGCQSSTWLINDTKDLYEHNMTSLTSLVHTDALVEYANGIGYNPADGFIWGYVNTSSTEQRLIKICKDKFGKYSSHTFGPILGAEGEPSLPVGINSNKAYINVDDVDKKGHLHLLYRQNANLGLSQEQDLLYVIDLNHSSSNYQKVIAHATVSNAERGLDIVDENDSVISGEYQNNNDYNATKQKGSEHQSYSDLFAIRPVAYRVTITDTEAYHYQPYTANDAQGSTLTPLSAVINFRGPQGEISGVGESGLIIGTDKESNTTDETITNAITPSPRKIDW